MQLDGDHGGCSAALSVLLLFMHANAAFFRNGGGVDAIHILKALQHAGDGGVADEVGLGLGEHAAVEDLNGVDAALAGLREERAKTTCEIDVGRKLNVLFV